MDSKEYFKKQGIKYEYDLDFEITNIVLEARLSKGWTQRQLAEAVGTKQPSIARVENGEVEPSISFLNKVAKAVGKKLIIKME